jgi:predicted ATPase
MQRFILTGAPGCGKTTVLRALAEMGHAVVEEAATDVIARAHAAGDLEPHTKAAFIDEIVAVQRRRQLEARPAPLQFFDRSPVCTHALSLFLGYPISPALAAELDRIERGRIYQRRVLFVDALGFVEPTAARRITLGQSVAFEHVHEESYRLFGYELVRIPVGPVADRAQRVLAEVRAA